MRKNPGSPNQSAVAGHEQCAALRTPISQVARWLQVAEPLRVLLDRPHWVSAINHGSQLSSLLVEILAAKNDLSKAAANAVLETLIDTVQTAVKKGDAVQLVGFGTFKST